jgi:hypothetical protein
MPSPLPRLIHFAGSTVAIETRGRRAARLVDFLLQDIASPPATLLPHTTFRLQTNRNGYALTRDGAPVFEDYPAGLAADTLQAGVCYQLAYESRAGLLFHAAGLADSAGGLLMPGRAGAGKSTLAAWLTANGLRYLSDELVYFTAGDSCLQGFTRPLHLKPPTLDVIYDALGRSKPADGFIHSPISDLLPYRLLNPQPAPPLPPLTGIIFTRFTAGSPGTCLPLTGAAAAVELVKCLINARNLPGHGFAETARLARLAPAWQLEYGHFEHLPELLSTCLPGFCAG